MKWKLRTWRHKIVFSTLLIAIILTSWSPLMLYGVIEHSYSDLSLSFPSTFTSSEGSINRTQDSVVIGDIGFNNISWITSEIILHPYLFTMATTAKQEVKDATDAYILVQSSSPSISHDGFKNLNGEGTSIFAGNSTTCWVAHYAIGSFSVDVSDKEEGASLEYISSGGDVHHRFEYQLPNKSNLSDAKYIAFVIKSSQTVSSDSNLFFYIHDGVYERRWYLGRVYTAANEWQQIVIPIANFSYEPTGPSINLSKISMMGIELTTEVEPLTIWIDDIALYDELSPQVQLFFNNHLVLSEKTSFDDTMKLLVPIDLLKGQNNVNITVDAHVSWKVYSVVLVLITYVNHLGPIGESYMPFLFLIFALEVIITCYALRKTYKLLIHSLSSD